MSKDYFKVTVSYLIPASGYEGTDRDEMIKALREASTTLETDVDYYSDGLVEVEEVVYETN